MACSRIPKWRLRPAGFSALKSPAPSNVRRVLQEGPRSAEPPSSHGTFLARTFSTGPRHPGSPSPWRRRERRQAAVPSVRQLAAQHAVAVLREFWILAAVLLEFGPPCRLQRPPARADAGLEMLAHAVGYTERGVFRPAVSALGQADFFLAQRFAVRRAGVLFVRCPIGDVGIDNDQRRPIVRVLKVVKARSSISRSLASPTRVTFSHSR